MSYLGVHQKKREREIERKKKRSSFSNSAYILLKHSTQVLQKQHLSRLSRNTSTIAAGENIKQNVRQHLSKNFAYLHKNLYSELPQQSPAYSTHTSTHTPVNHKL